MKIVFILSNDFPEGEAKTMRIRAYARGMKELGHEVEVWVGYVTSFNIQKFNNKVEGTWNSIPFQILSKKVKYQSGFLFKVKDWIMANFNLFRLFSKNKSNDIQYLIYMPNWNGLLLAIVLSFKLYKIKFTLIETELFSSYNKSWKTFFVKRTEELKSQIAEKLLVLTPQLENAFLQYKGKAAIIRITPVVVEIDRFNMSSTIQSYTIGYVGTFGDKDGVNTIIEAFLEAKKTIPLLRLKLIGRYKPENVYDSTSIIYTGGYRTSELNSLLDDCDTLILNRRNDEYSRHGFPIKLAEYLACKKPILLCDFALYHQYLNEDEVFYFNPDDRFDIIRGIKERYENHIDANKKAEKAFLKCEKFFSHKAAAMELEKIISN